MQTPVCSFCAKTDVLCEHCESRLKNKEISELDVEISKYLIDKYSEIEVEYVSSFQAKDFLLLFFKGNVGAIVGKNGKGAFEIGKKFGKKVKIIKLDSDTHQIITDIITPVELLGVNTLFTGEKEVYKIRLAKKDMVRIPFDIDSLQKILMKILKKEVQFVFE